jgi:hypothetical protein
MVDHVAHPENVGSRHTSEGREGNMKSWLAFGLCAVGMGVLVSTVEQGYADENDGATTCTLATLKGRYLFALHGTLLPPAFGVTEPTESDAAGFHIFNGNGTGTDIVTFRLGGVTVLENDVVPLSYTVDADCTGSFTVTNGPSFDIFVSPNGESFAEITTAPPGNEGSDIPRRVSRK